MATPEEAAQAIRDADTARANLEKTQADIADRAARDQEKQDNMHNQHNDNGGDNNRGAEDKGTGGGNQE